MQKFLTTLHRWLGFPLGLLFVVTFGTGFLNTIDELLKRGEHALYNSAYEYRKSTTVENAAALVAITSEKENIGQIIMPTEHTPYYRVASRAESWTYAIDDLTNVTYTKNDDDGFFRTVLQLHRNFLLGKEGLFGIDGKYYAAWVSLIAILLSLLGLWLWWPKRATFNVKEMWPKSKKRKHFYYSHLSSGVVVLAVIVIMGLTGASITYRSISQQLFGVEGNKTSPIQETLPLAYGWQVWIEAGYAQMPGGSQLMLIRYPRQARGNEQDGRPSDILEFRFATPSDWFGLAQSSVKIDRQSSTLVDVTHFGALPLNEKIYSLLKPLHTGHDLPLIYTVVLFIFSFLGTVMVFSGLISFAIKKRKWTKPTQIVSRKLNRLDAIDADN